MAANSKIEWTHHTFNPWRGCDEVSPGCDNCYARTMAKRNPKTLGQWGPNGTRVVASEAQWKLPSKWNAAAACQCGGGFRGVHSPYCPQADRPRVFCASLADVSEDWSGQLKMSNGQWANRNYHQGRFVGYQGVNLSGGNNALSMDDVRLRLIRLFSTLENLDLLLLTKRPENVLPMLDRIGDMVDTYTVTIFELPFNPLIRSVRRRSVIWA